MPQVVPDPNMASYNAFWDGAVGSRGYWGSLPQSPHSVFSPSFNTKGNNKSNLIIRIQINVSTEFNGSFYE